MELAEWSMLLRVSPAFVLFALRIVLVCSLAATRIV
jgi:hypothetical protein